MIAIIKKTKDENKKEVYLFKNKSLDYYIYILYFKLFRINIEIIEDY